MMTSLDKEILQEELKKKRICRFCLTQVPQKISNIYLRDTRIKSSAPLPIQIMAIASIEVFSNDGMPPFVCSDCTNMFEYSYQFKQMCKKADNLLRQFPLTGVWPAALKKPVLATSSTPIKIIKTVQTRVQQNSNAPATNVYTQMPKKILNLDQFKPANTIESITPDISPQFSQDTEIITKMEKVDSDCTITFLEKIENNEELSIDDIQQLIAAEDINDAEEENMEHTIVVQPVNTSNKPKLLNKATMRILNKDAEQANEPRLTVPTIKQDVDGKTEIIAEILNEDDNYGVEPDPNNALPIETNVYPCNKCERSFPLLQLRDLHMKNHTRDRKFHCEYCEKSFFSKYDLHRHSFIHNGERPYKCAICEKAFSRSSLLTRHEKSHTDVPKYICIHCERAFISKDDMEKHAEKHNINRPFICKICKKGFAFKQGLERHEVVHARQQPFPCQYCKESFSTTTKLARHLTAHAGHRPYPCKFCGKSYLLSHHLTRHMRSHKTPEDPANDISFTCMQCDQSFEAREMLIKHSATHANETNLACSLCKDVFDTMAELVSHIEEHSSGELYACEFCDLIFMSADKLQIHTDTDHTHEMEAYHADDRAQANMKQVLKNERTDMDKADEGLQNSVNEFLNDEKFVEENNSRNSLLKINLKSEKRSPKIINQIIIQSPVDNKDHEDDSDEGNSLLIPLKQRKLSTIGKKVTTQSETAQEAKQSSIQIRRKLPIASAATTTARDPNQPSIQSMFKLPKGVTLKTTNTSSNKTPPGKAAPTKTPPSKSPTAKILPTKPTAMKTTPTRTSTTNAPSSSKTSPTKTSPAASMIDTESIKVEKDLVEDSASNDSGVREQRKVKVQKITVTKAQAAAMAKEGRIKIKNGKIILKK